jgi:white-opaque regulator 2
MPPGLNPPFHPAAPHQTVVRNFQPTPSSTSYDSEKAKMLRGQFFQWMDKTLADDRVRCKRALVSFNNACMADDAGDLISWQILKQILLPNSSNSLHTDKPIGSLGAGAVVETPFQCEYGYNIKICDDVHIGRNCTITDVYTVIIGRNTTIGPKVTIVAGTPADRQGINSKWKGYPVIIEENVIIGAGAFIYPGVRLGAGCTIDPGSMVKHDVLPNQRVGPPAAVLVRQHWSAVDGIMRML